MGVGNGLFLLVGHILVAVGHAHVPLGFVNAFRTNGFQNVHGTLEGDLRLVLRRSFLVVSEDGVVFQGPGQSVGGSVIPLILGDGLQSPYA